MICRCCIDDVDDDSDDDYDAVDDDDNVCSSIVIAFCSKDGDEIIAIRCYKIE